MLSINLFNDLIFIFLWFWLFFVSIFNLIDVISWIKTLVVNKNQDSYSYIEKRLGEASIRITDENEAELLRDFVKTYLREDVVFVLRILSLRNSHYQYKDLVVHRIVANLFNIYSAAANHQTQSTTQLFDHYNTFIIWYLENRIEFKLYNDVCWCFIISIE